MSTQEKCREHGEMVRVFGAVKFPKDCGKDCLGRECFLRTDAGTEKFFSIADAKKRGETLKNSAAEIFIRQHFPLRMSDTEDGIEYKILFKKASGETGWVES